MLVYLAVSKLGEAPIDGITDTNPEGLTSACGPWAGAFAARLRKGGLTCHVRGAEEYAQAMLEKHVWICGFMLVGAMHGGVTVGKVSRGTTQPSLVTLDPPATYAVHPAEP